MLFQARAATDALFGPQTLAFHDLPIPERHRTIFYFAHFEAFDGNLLTKQQGVRHSIRHSTNSFPFGIDPEPGQLPRRAHGHISLVGTTNLMATRSPAFAKEIIADRGERLEGSSRTLLGGIREYYAKGSRLDKTVGRNSATVGWICIARWTTVYGAFAYMTSSKT